MLYRIYPARLGTPPDEPGGALYAPGGGSGRISNPSHYHELYFCDDPEGAIAETFGRVRSWDERMLARSGWPMVLGAYRLRPAAHVCDLDDPAELLRQSLRPSHVVTTERKRSQSWARGVYDQGEFAGIRWWSPYDSRWFVFGIWDRDQLEIIEPGEALRIDDARIERTAQALSRRIARPPSS
jgi:hypothetical protein